MIDIKIINKIAEINAMQWNNLVIGDYPFLQHQFLNALEINDCASQKYGWQPCHIAIYEDNILIGATPLYLKSNTYGEFVFDQAWEQFYAQNGVKYFPKLVSSIPYTPATGQRFLSVKNRESEIYSLLLKSIKDFAKKVGASGWHGLFVNEKTQEFLAENNLMTRFDCQYHWQNNNYGNFDDFLITLKKKRRKNIRYERKALKNNENIQIRVLNGFDVTAKDIADFSHFYKRTFDEKSGVATLNNEFFTQIAKEMPKQFVLFLVDIDDKCIAGALCYAGDTTLYGRHWGCDLEVEFLHFEACYYQGIEYCIKHNLQTFEPGAGGVYKLSRGFDPIKTQSCHLLFDEKFIPAIDDFTKREQVGVLEYIKNAAEKSAYNL